MKTEFNPAGSLVIKPENATERFALKAWAEDRRENKLSGKFVIDLTPSPMAPSPAPNPEYVKEF